MNLLFLAALGALYHDIKGSIGLCPNPLHLAWLERNLVLSQHLHRVLNALHPLRIYLGLGPDLFYFFKNEKGYSMQDL